MKYWLRGKPAGLVIYLIIAALVIGGLGWVTVAALRLEKQQWAAQAELEQKQWEARKNAAEYAKTRLALAQRIGAQQELSTRLRLALWRLDSRVFPVIAKEGSRPFYHYSSTYSPPFALIKKGTTWEPAQVLSPSPLLNEELPEWVLLHFQTDLQANWESPQVLSRAEATRLNNDKLNLQLDNVTPRREELLAELRKDLASKALFARIEKQEEQLANVYEMNWNLRNTAQTQEPRGQSYNPDPAYGKQQLEQEYANRVIQRRMLDQQFASFFQDSTSNTIVIKTGDSEITVRQGAMVPLWMPTSDRGELLVLARMIQVGKKKLCQGLVLDWDRLRSVLTEEVSDLFPDAEIVPSIQDVPVHPERAMTALPLELDPGIGDLKVDEEALNPSLAQSKLSPELEETPQPAPAPLEGWTPLRGGLALAWLAAIVALAAVGLGGWSLLDLSERRMRFVSAVTHELRTPLTTLRLYLDMLTGGMVKDDTRRQEYLHTLNAESDRLTRLVGNVLDFSRLENQQPRLELKNARINEVLEQVRGAWEDRCRDAGKTLVIENGLGAEEVVRTDPVLLQQVLCNLIDNACKYSRDAKDPHVWLRARAEGNKLVFEVEDRGPGISASDRGTVFRAFRRGRGADTTAGGVGLGLALGKRWMRLLGGRLSLRSPTGATGACFQVTLPRN